MELASVERSILVVIDLQGKLVEMVHRPRLVMAATKRLLRMADLFGVPVMLTEQYPRERVPTKPRYHGRHQLNRYADGLEKCIGCELCA